MLSPVEKSDIRRHLGFPALAVNRSAIGSSGALRNYGLNASLEALESRLDELDVTDEARLTGACLGSVAVVGQDPNAGNTVTVTITSDDLEDPVVLVATAAAGDTKFLLTAKLTAAAAQNIALVTAGFVPAGPFGGPVVLAPNSFPQFELKAPNPFTLSVAFSGITAATVTNQGIRVEPSVIVGKDDDDIDIVKYGYIPILNYLHSAIGGVTKNSALAKAGDYVRGRELKERMQLKQIWRNDLATFLGMELRDGGGGGFAM